MMRARSCASCWSSLLPCGCAACSLPPSDLQPEHHQAWPESYAQAVEERLLEADCCCGD